MQSKRIRVFLMDGQEVVRSGLCAILDQTEDLMVVGECGSCPEAVERASSLRPDLLVTDVWVGQDSGLTAASAIKERSPETKILVLSSIRDDESMMESILAGASGFLLKEGSASKLVDGMRAIVRGESLLDVGLMGILLERLRAPEGSLSLVGTLTSRENEILKLVAAGRTNREIASELHFSESSVKNAMSRILAKLGMARRSEAAAYFVAHTRSAFTAVGSRAS